MATNFLFFPTRSGQVWVAGVRLWLKDFHVIKSNFPNENEMKIIY